MTPAPAPAPMLTVDAARARILAGLAATGAETVPLSDAWGRVTARAVAARRTQPPAPMSAMDGYALRAAEAAPGARLRVAGASPAGHPFAGALAPGEAVRIFTGGVVPEGADAILIQEEAEADATHVTVRGAVAAGRHVRRAGLDFAAGDALLPAGRRLSARDVGLAAAGDRPWLSVHRRPRVALLATGDEVAMPGEPVGPGGIVSSNVHALAALVRAGGGEPVLLETAPDDEGAIVAAALAARGCDLLVTSGGASVGDHDLVRAALGAEGFALDFWRVAMRPGKPLLFGRLGGTPVLGLPGNPVSALVCAVLFLRPALDRLSGLPGDPPPLRPALAGRDLPANDHRQDHLRATLSADAEGRRVATPCAVQDSAMLATLARADALVVRAPGAPALAAGGRVEVIALGPLGL